MFLDILGDDVLVTTPSGGIWLIYKHDPLERKVPEGGVLINQPYHDCRWDNLIYFPLSVGSSPMIMSADAYI